METERLGKIVAGELKPVGKRVLVAWNGSREASRATFDCLSLLSPGAELRLLTVDSARGDATLAAITRALTRHGIKPQPVSVSKNEGRSTAEEILKYMGEIRFGPAYYSLTIDKIALRERVFGSSYLWSPDSRYFAVQEWQTTFESRGPQTRLLLIDLDLKQACVLSRAERGFVVPRKFEENKLIYTKEYYQQSLIQEFEIEFLSVDRWDNIN